MALIFGLLLGSALVLAARAVNIGDACTSHAFCNYGPGSVANTRCVSGSCQCTAMFYGETMGSLCVKAYLGEDCSAKQDPLAFCLTASLNSSCVSGLCACDAGFHVAIENGRKICRKIGIGSTCDPADNGDAFCKTAIPDTMCTKFSETCQCPSGRTFVPSTGKCETELFVPACATCRQTGGHCYEIGSSGTPTGCACRYPKSSSGATPADTLNVGCDRGFAEIGDSCEIDGKISCSRENTKCVHGADLSSRMVCKCKPGYFPIPDDNNPWEKCVPSLAAVTDRNCDQCIKGKGVCYDIDGDRVRDGCVCPNSRSTSDPYDPSTDCDIKHVTVECGADKMKMCYLPHNTSALSNMGPKLAATTATIYIKNHLGQDPCVPEKEPNSDRWCVSVSLAEDKMGACGTSMSYPSRGVVVYQNFLIVQTKSGNSRGPLDLNFHSYCQFDTKVHAFTASGSEVVGFASMASEGDEVHPTLEMVIYDEFKRDAALQGVRLGQPAMLEVIMKDNKGIYSSIRPEVCIATNRPELASPDTSSLLLLFQSCPVEDSYLNLRNTFFRDQVDAQISRTGLFPMFQFEGSDYVFFHCAVRVCRFMDNCKPANCSEARRKRSIPDGESGSTQGHGPVVKRSVATSSLEPLKSYPVKVLPEAGQQDASGLEDVNTSKKGLKKRPFIAIVVIGGILVILVLAVVALVYNSNRRAHSGKFEVY